LDLVQKVFFHNREVLVLLLASSSAVVLRDPFDREVLASFVVQVVVLSSSFEVVLLSFPYLLQEDQSFLVQVEDFLEDHPYSGNTGDCG
jgi:hypothetical protein